MTELFIFDNDKYLYPLPKEIEDHIEQYHEMRRRESSLYAYSHLVSILDKRGYDVDKILFTSLGKAIHEDVYFSMSHSENYIVIAISSHSLGVDVEEIIPEGRLALSKRILTKEEWIEFENSLDKALYLTKKWTLKEAYGKSLGTGLTKEAFEKEIQGYTMEMKNACISIYPMDEVVIKEE